MASDTHPPFPMAEPVLPSSTMPGNMHGSDWYSSSIPVSTSYEFDFQNPYITPYSTSVSNFSPVSDFPKFSEAQANLSKEAAAGTKLHEQTYLPFFVPTYDNLLPARPRSSPSTFTPTCNTRLEDLTWPPNGLGIMHSRSFDIPATSSQYPHPMHRAPRESRPLAGSIQEVLAPQPKRTYANIAPNPISAPRPGGQKRTHDDEEAPEDLKRRKRSDSAAVTTELTEEDKLLIQLKDEESLPWKDIAARFQSDLGKTYQIPALQMRLKRLRERLRVWTEPDVKALRLAHEYWIQNKYDIIASKMVEFGALERWSSRQCARKWQEIDPGPTPYSNYDTPTPNYSQFTTSPVEAPSFLPFLHIPQ